MKVCPKCHVGSISVEKVLISKPLLNYSISGAQTKIVAEQKIRVTCTECPLEVYGHLEDPKIDSEGNFVGGHFVEER